MYIISRLSIQYLVQVYSVIMTEYLAGGGDGFKVISEHKERQLQGPLDTDILKVGPRWTLSRLE